jgi:hypothetical protein
MCCAQVYVTDCEHTFCDDCLVRCLRVKPECPLCRRTLSLVRLLHHRTGDPASSAAAANTVMVKVSYNKQRFEVELSLDTRIADLFEFFGDLFHLNPAFIKIGTAHSHRSTWSSASHRSRLRRGDWLYEGSRLSGSCLRRMSCHIVFVSPDGLSLASLRCRVCPAVQFTRIS